MGFVSERTEDITARGKNAHNSIFCYFSHFQNEFPSGLQSRNYMTKS